PRHVRLPATATKPARNSETSRSATTGLVQCSKYRLFFDHLVGAYHQGQGHFEAECLGGFQVDDELDLRDLLERPVSRLFALENLPDIETSHAIGLSVAGAIAHQAAIQDILACLVDGRHLVECSQRQELIAIAVKKRTRTDNNRACLAFDKSREGRLEVAIAADFRDSDLPPDRARRRKRVTQHLLAHHNL